MVHAIQSVVNLFFPDIIQEPDNHVRLRDYFDFVSTFYNRKKGERFVQSKSLPREKQARATLQRSEAA